MVDVEQLLANVPPAYQQRFVEIAEFTDKFCDKHLNDEYKAACRMMAYTICQEGLPFCVARSPVGRVA